MEQLPVEHGERAGPNLPRREVRGRDAGVREHADQGAQDRAVRVQPVLPAHLRLGADAEPGHHPERHAAGRAEADPRLHVQGRDLRGEGADRRPAARRGEAQGARPRRGGGGERGGARRAAGRAARARVDEERADEAAGALREAEGGTVADQRLDRPVRDGRGAGGPGAAGEAAAAVEEEEDGAPEPAQAVAGRGRDQGRGAGGVQRDAVRRGEQPGGHQRLQRGGHERQFRHRKGKRIDNFQTSSL